MVPAQPCVLVCCDESIVPASRSGLAPVGAEGTPSLLPVRPAYGGPMTERQLKTKKTKHVILLLIFFSSTLHSTLPRVKVCPGAIVWVGQVAAGGRDAGVEAHTSGVTAFRVGSRCGTQCTSLFCV